MVKRVMDEVNLQNDFVPDSTATLAKARAMMSELGIRAEDNIFSCGIIAVRDEE